MIGFNINSKYIAILSAALFLTGCLGGTVAQQVARSIATSVADNAVARALDVQDGPSNRKPDYASQTYAKNTQTAQNAYQNSSVPQPYKPAAAPATKEDIAKQTLQHNKQLKQSFEQTPVDPFMYAMATSGFKETKLEEIKPIAEPLPDSNAAETEGIVEVIQTNQLVRVELFNLLIGEEKNAVYEKARLIGATLPRKNEWQQWQVGTGISLHDKKVVTFLIPPEFGKLPSGSVAMVELASPGELNVARYKAN